MNDKDARPLYVCMSRAFFGNRFFNPGDQVRSKKHPGPSFRVFNPESDPTTVRVSTVPTDDFAQD
jgi:hypothetical protein